MPIRSIKVGSPQYKANIRRQKILHALGYIRYDAIDGSWGPGLQKLYNKLSATDKLYASIKITTQEALEPFRKEEKKAKTNAGHAIYLNYPNFKGSAENAVKFGKTDLGKTFNKITGLHGNYLPVGHAANILVDSDGNAKYVEYGRYGKNDPAVIGKEKRTVKGGNWRMLTLPKQESDENDSVYLRRVENMLPDTKTGYYTATTIPNVDTNKALQYVKEQANNKKREEYNLLHTCAVEAAKLGLDFRINKGGSIHAFNPTSGYDWGSILWGYIPGSEQYISNQVMWNGKTYGMTPVNSRK